jgi:Fur family transcriptional regulator, peroxide stress response regulator
MKSLQASEILKESGIKPSLHRIKILEYLIEKKNHPTVDLIFKDISGEIPTLSKTTIYNTLKTFHENNIVQLLTIEGNEVKYDVILEKHAHFKCIRCEKLYDLSVSTKPLTLKNIDGHKILDGQLSYRGICKNCQN